MLESIFTNNDLTVTNLLICSSVSLILGLIIALVHKITSKYSKNFLITLAVLPVLVMTIIFMTNGNLLRSKMAAAGDISMITKLSKLLNINRVTAGYKISGKSQFTQREIEIIANNYDLTGDEVKEIFLS